MEFIKKHKKAYMSVLMILCLILIVITILYRTRPTFVENALGYVIVPVQKAFSTTLTFVNDKISFLNNLQTIEAENERLAERLKELEAENSRLALVDAENEKLTKLLELSQKYSDYPKVGAQITAKDPGNWYDAFVIDKGENDGFRRNMVVLADGGLVGRIVESGASWSKVVSLIDDTFSVSAKSARTDDIGFVRGDTNLMFEGLCRMDYIDYEADILVGDEIVTSNLHEIYPPGIIIGHVKEIVTDANGLTKYAIIQPTVDFKHLETVLVINETFEDKVTGTEE